MKLLILGGTIFLGRHLVEQARARGHEATLFNRGQHHPELFPDVEKLRGDRDGGMAVLRGRRWDAVIDTSGYVPRVVAEGARLLAEAVDHYTFVSSISVYESFAAPGLDESTPVGTLADLAVETVDGDTYGPLKALCEHAAEAAMPGRVLHIRPGLIIGPHDPTDRFSYWVERLARGGEVLAPGEETRPVQVIDASDLAAWTIRMVEAQHTGIFNATGPAQPLSMGGVLHACAAEAASTAQITWVDEAFLTEQGIAPWQELPLWLPNEDANVRGMLQVSIARALAAGLAFRPLHDTIRDTLAWLAERPADHAWRAGLPPERERAVLAAWHGRAGAAQSAGDVIR